eukprot:g3567.t1
MAYRDLAAPLSIFSPQPDESILGTTWGLSPLSTGTSSYGSLNPRKRQRSPTSHRHLFVTTSHRVVVYQYLFDDNNDEDTLYSSKRRLSNNTKAINGVQRRERSNSTSSAIVAGPHHALFSWSLAGYTRRNFTCPIIHAHCPISHTGATKIDDDHRQVSTMDTVDGKKKNDSFSLLSMSGASSSNWLVGALGDGEVLAWQETTTDLSSSSSSSSSLEKNSTVLSLERTTKQQSKRSKGIKEIIPVPMGVSFKNTTIPVAIGLDEQGSYCELYGISQQSQHGQESNEGGVKLIVLNSSSDSKVEVASARKSRKTAKVKTKVRVLCRNPGAYRDKSHAFEIDLIVNEEVIFK